MLSHSKRAYDSQTTTLLTAPEVADRLSVSLATVRRLIAAGELTKVAVGGSVRVAAGDLEALIERGRNSTPGGGA